ncbi:MAG: diaminopimelate decarboxylase [Ignavibacteriota bacterium]
MTQSAFLFRDNLESTDLYCEDVLLSGIAKEFGTPLYVYSESQLLSDFRRFRDSLSAAKGSYVSYAVKANSNPEILRLLANENAGASVVSGGELLAALAAGFIPSRITFDGPGKTDEEILLALQSDIFAIDIESKQELEVVNELASSLHKKAPICIRVNPHIDAKTHPYISTGLSHNKFGIPFEDAKDAFVVANSLPNIEIIGIHCHIGSQIVTVEPFVEAARSLVGFIAELSAQSGIDIKHINFGGGIGIDYHSTVTHDQIPESVQTAAPFSVEEFSAAIIPILSSSGCTYNFEPGRAIIANAGVIVSKTLYTKTNGEKNFAIIDASMTDLIRPSLYHAFHQIVPLHLAEESSQINYDIVGPVCESSDFLAQDRVMAPLERGDLLAILSTGAYGYVLASNYNLRPRAAEVLVCGSTCRIIRERENILEII